MLSGISSPFANATGTFGAPTMGAAMDTAFAVGTPTNRDQAQSVLATAGDYVSGANGMLAKITEGIRVRSEGLDALSVSDPAAASAAREQIDLLERLRDRVQTSITRVTDIVAGTSGDVGGKVQSAAARREDDLALLEKRRAMLAPSVDLTAGFGDAASAYRGA